MIMNLFTIITTNLDESFSSLIKDSTGKPADHVYFYNPIEDKFSEDFTIGCGFVKRSEAEAVLAEFEKFNTSEYFDLKIVAGRIDTNKPLN